MMKPNCETIRKSHDYEVIGVEPVNPKNIDITLSMIPEYGIETYSTVTYECRECSDIMMKVMPTTEAEIEEENSEKGKVGTTTM